MADPLSVAASIIAVVTVAAQVGGLINDFVSNYRAADSELKDIAVELNALRAVLGSLHRTYRTGSTLRRNIPPSTLTADSQSQHESHENDNFGTPPTDAALKVILYGLNVCMGKLDDVVTKSNERMKKGGLRKVQVQALWQRTSKGIDKIRLSLSGYKMTLMLFLEAKALETTATPEVIGAAVKAALDRTADYRKDIEAGERAIGEVRKYLEDTENLPAASKVTQVGSANAIKTFPGFHDWLASFSVTADEEQKDEELLKAFKRTRLEANRPDSGGAPAQSHKVNTLQEPASQKTLLIITNLQKLPSSSMFVEQFYVESNTEIKKILELLQDKGYSSVTGFQLTGPKKTGMVGPIYHLDSSVSFPVTSGNSRHDVSQGLCINEDETLVAFYNQYIMARRPKRTELRIYHEVDGIRIRDTLMQDESVIYFKRTLRVPEDEKLHDLPATFGCFPLISVSSCDEGKVPPAMKKKGGMLIPMLQREAMCIALSSDDIYRSYSYSGRWAMGPAPNCLYAVKVYAGGVNTITGQTPTEGSTLLQDYYVAPLQKRVDGFQAGGNIKQFVAMPLGAGYSVESQLNGAEIGGLQLQIAPRMKTTVKFHSLSFFGAPLNVSLPLFKTPRQIGLRAGQTIRMMEEKESRLAADWNWGESQVQTTPVDDWAHWTESKCLNELDKCQYCDIDRHSERARPAYLSDLSNDADVELQGALVVSALQPISITLKHVYANWCTLKERELFRTTLTVSPFENASVLRSRIGHTLEQWYGNHPMESGRFWEIRPSYKNIATAERFAYVGLHEIGITDGFVIETLEKQHEEGANLRGYGGLRFSREDGEAWEPAKPRPKGWEMALAGGGSIQNFGRGDPIPGHWNWDASHFVNIQILNTVAFESLTGLAPPPVPISMMEYSKAQIPSLSYYSDDYTSPHVKWTFPSFKTVGEIDSMFGVNYAVRLNSSGKPVGCVVCERRICDSVIDPCHHAFCGACIRQRMQKAKEVTCILCSKPAERVIVSSAAMETLGEMKSSSSAQAPTPLPVGESVHDDWAPSEIQSRLPSLRKLEKLNSHSDVKHHLRGTEGPDQRFVQEMLLPDKSPVDELICRLAVAQISKDVNYPREPLPEYVRAAAGAVLARAIRCFTSDTVELLLSLGPKLDSQSAAGKSLVARAWTARREVVAKRLIEEGCDYSVLEEEMEDRDMFRSLLRKQYNVSSDLDVEDVALRRRLLEHAQQQKERTGAGTVIVEAR